MAAACVGPPECVVRLPLQPAQGGEGAAVAVTAKGRASATDILVSAPGCPKLMVVSYRALLQSADFEALSTIGRRVLVRAPGAGPQGAAALLGQLLGQARQAALPGPAVPSLLGACWVQALPFLPAACPAVPFRYVSAPLFAPPRSWSPAPRRTAWPAAPQP